MQTQGSGGAEGKLSAAADAKVNAAVASAQALQDKVANDNVSLDSLDDVEGLADEAMGFADKLASWWDNESTQDLCQSDIQDLELKKLSDCERKMAAYSALGQLFVDAANQGLNALPFGAPAAAALGAIYGRGVQAMKANKNCRRLLAQVKRTDKALARLASSKREHRPETKGALLRLTRSLMAAAKAVKAYTGRQGNLLLRWVLSNSDQTKFERLDKQLASNLMALGVELGVDATLSEPFQSENSEALRQALCEAARLDPKDDANVEKALVQLSKEAPEKLKELMAMHCKSFENSVLQAELDMLAQRVLVLEVKVEQHTVAIEQHGLRIVALEKQMMVLAKAESDGALPEYLRVWWNTWLDDLSNVVTGSQFVGGIIQWFKDAGKEALLSKYDMRLTVDGVLGRLDVQQDRAPGVFVKMVLLRLADEDEDEQVTKGELYRLQLTANEWARRISKEPEPNELSELCRVILMNFNCEQLQREYALRNGAKTELVLIADKLQVTAVVNSYALSKLTSQYHEGSRQWMYDEVNAWLDTATRAAVGSAEAPSISRLFLLLADAGMGKSVFSAVMATKLEVRLNAQAELVLVQHFFKVGEPRSQGRKMLLCLAQQLAEKLPGFAHVLAPLVEEHGDGQALPDIRDVFEKFLLEPLQQLHEKRAQPGSDLPATHVLMLLDALDESDDAGKGWQPITMLVAYNFIKLPPWVSLLLTSRPQVEAWFKGWKPERINPDDPRNRDDIKSLVRQRLLQDHYVAAVDVDAATQLMVTKSEGQFIYTKFAFEALRAAAGSARPPWLPAALKGKLPLGSGVTSMYHHSMETLHAALGAERPDLLRLLVDRLLPVLAVSRELLTVQELAWAAGDADDKQVDLLTRLLGNIFPLRNERVTPYHKSVLDWLIPGAGQPPHCFTVDADVGHALLARACCKLLLGSPYALRHAVAHACHLLKSASAGLEEKEQAAWALRSVVANSREAAGKAASSGAIAPLVALLQPGSGASDGARHHVAGALANMSETYAGKVMAAKAVPPLVALLKLGSGASDETRQQAALALWNVVDGSEEGQKQIIMAGAINLIESLIEPKADASNALRGVAAGLLVSVADSEFHHLDWEDEGDWEDDGEGRDLPVREEKEKCWKLLKHAEVVTHLVDLLQPGSQTSGRTKQLVAGAVVTLMSSSDKLEFVALVDSAGAVALLVELLQPGSAAPDEAKRLAICALADLLSSDEAVVSGAAASLTWLLHPGSEASLEVKTVAAKRLGGWAEGQPDLVTRLASEVIVPSVALLQPGSGSSDGARQQALCVLMEWVLMEWDTFGAHLAAAGLFPAAAALLQPSSAASDTTRLQVLRAMPYIFYREPSRASGAIPAMVELLQPGSGASDETIAAAASVLTLTGCGADMHEEVYEAAQSGGGRLMDWVDFATAAGQAIAPLVALLQPRSGASDDVKETVVESLINMFDEAQMLKAALESTNELKMKASLDGVIADWRHAIEGLHELTVRRWGNICDGRNRGGLMGRLNPLAAGEEEEEEEC